MAYVTTPYFLAGFFALYPSRWLAVSVLLLASLHATYLLFAGLPRYMRIPENRGMLFATSVWGVGLLVLVTVLVSAILHWDLVLQPHYQRSGPEQGYPSAAERPQTPDGLR
jgi:ABC-type anion transport system duplicated permease subunit